MMIFNTKKLVEMKAELEKKNGVLWDKAYLLSIDSHAYSCISDYDTYANWMKVNHRTLCNFQPFYNKAMPRTLLLTLNDLSSKYGNTYKSLSFHHYAS